MKRLMSNTEFRNLTQNTVSGQLLNLCYLSALPMAGAYFASQGLPIVVAGFLGLVCVYILSVVMSLVLVFIDYWLG